MDARQSRRGKRISLQQEKRAAADLGGKTMAMSGAARLGGGADVRVMGKTRVECKFTEKDTYVLRYIELEKVRKQAAKALESPVLQFGFRRTTGRITTYAVIPFVEGPGTWICWNTDAKQKGLTEHELETTLMQGRISLQFLMPGNDPFVYKVYEILRWHDYVERTALKCEEVDDGD